jgi:transposase
MVLKVRETLVGQRTQLANTLRGHAAEFGVIAAKGSARLTTLVGGTFVSAIGLFGASYASLPVGYSGLGQTAAHS